MGYDIFSELIFATSTTLITGIVAAVISLVVGTVIDTIAAYLEGWKAEFANGFINVFLLIPNVWEVIWAKYIISVAKCMLTEASLSFMV